MPEHKLLLSRTPKTADAVDLYGFICPILKMLPYEVYLRVELEDTGLILESDKHYFDDLYHLSSKVGPGAAEAQAEYVPSLHDMRGYPVDMGSMYRSRRQLAEGGLLGRRATKAFMSRYAKSPLQANPFDSDIRWEALGSGQTVLVLTSSSEGDLRRIYKRVTQQLAAEEPA